MPDPHPRVRGRSPWLAAAVLALALTPPAAAQPPALLDAVEFSFPGSFPNPPSAPSAARALADTWLTPYGNPAAPAVFSVEVWPMAMHVGRQDLRADNRNFDETSAFFGGAGGAIGLGVPRGIGVWLYGWRPEARFEEAAFVRGTAAEPGVPASVQTRLEARETRIGAGLSAGIGAVRIGAAIERSLRKDRYLRVERSGDPESGTRELQFDGDASGAQFGVHWRSSAEPRGRIEIGIAARWLDELEVSGEETDDLFSGASTTPAAAIREAGWEGGISAAWGATEAFRLVAGVGGRTEQEWAGFDDVAGARLHVALAADYHDPRDAWGLHFGLGRDTEDGSVEESASVVGIGADWFAGPVTVSAAVMRRGLHRDGSPTSWEDRYLAGLRWRLD